MIRFLSLPRASTLIAAGAMVGQLAVDPPQGYSKPTIAQYVLPHIFIGDAGITRRVARRRWFAGLFLPARLGARFGREFIWEGANDEIMGRFSP